MTVTPEILERMVAALESIACSLETVEEWIQAQHEDDEEEEDEGFGGDKDMTSDLHKLPHPNARR